MSGPTAGVLTKFGDAERFWVAELLRSVSERIEGNDFWVSPAGLPEAGAAEGRPFIYLPRQMVKEDDQDLDELERVFGFRPAYHIGFAAMCNGPEDHRLLGHLCERTARQTGGVIDFSGYLHSGEPPFPNLVAEGLRDINRRHVGTPDFLRKWLTSPRFHMVK